MVYRSPGTSFTLGDALDAHEPEKAAASLLSRPRERPADEYRYYHVERNHHGLDNRLIEKPHGVINMNSTVRRHERMGGILNYYERGAA
jgi:hypothetical protein